MTNEPNDPRLEFAHPENRIVIRELSQQIIGQVRPQEVEVSMFVLDPLIEKAAEGKTVQTGDNIEFGLGGGELLAIVVVPILVNWLSNLLQEFAVKSYRAARQHMAQSSANTQLSETDVDQRIKQSGMRLKRKEKAALVQTTSTVIDQVIRQLAQSLETRTHIFLSYAQADQKQVERLYAALSHEDFGFAPWMESEDILPGEVTATAIERAIRNSDYFVACLSSSLLQESGTAWKNMRAALDIFQELPEHHIYVIPARLESCDMPHMLKPLYPVDLFEPDGIPRLIKAILLSNMRKVAIDTKNL